MSPLNAPQDRIPQPAPYDPHYDQVVRCPECHVMCEWCAWYATNARVAGCGLSVPTGYGRPTKRRCEWGETLKGTTCGLCGGSEKVRLSGSYRRIGDTEQAGGNYPVEPSKATEGSPHDLKSSPFNRPTQEPR